MKWFKRFVLALLLLTLAGAGVIWILLPPVNIPFSGMLANFFPDYFERPQAEEMVVAQHLKVPEGFQLSLFAKDVPDARFLMVTDQGDVLVTAQRQGRVLLLQKDSNGDGVSDGRRVLLEGLSGPNGLDIHKGYLYVAEESQVGRAAFDAQRGVITGDYEVLIEGLPAGGNHWRKTIHFGPDGLLYMTVGSSCNVCLEEDERRAAMLRFDESGKYLGIYATGLRNSAGFDWSPRDGQLYATDNGRDLLGDDYPPCELNRIEQGGFYGWPYANGNRDPDPDFGTGREGVIAASLPPVYEFRAHNAPLGIRFLRSSRQPPHYQGAALVALHGSWNRSEKDGYKVVSLHWGADGHITAENFLSGFLSDGQVIGRPAEVAEGPEGNIYVSDDYANAVYRVWPGAGGRGEISLAAPRAVSDHYNASEVDDVTRALALVKGAELYSNAGCSACHLRSTQEAQSSKADTQGKVTLRGLSQRYDLAGLDGYLEKPRQPMPPYPGSDSERRLLSIYLMESELLPNRTRHQQGEATQ